MRIKGNWLRFFTTVLVFGLAVIGCDIGDTNENGDSRNNATELTLGKWADGTLAANGTQWFKFTAIAATQYIHFNFGSLTDLTITIYNNKNNIVVNETNLYGNASYVTLSASIDQTYFIKVQPYVSHSGTYRISFSRSTSDSFEAAAAGGAVSLSQGIWANGLLAANGVQWFSFTATETTKYIHVSFGSLPDLYLSIYNSNGMLVLNQTNLYNNTTYASLQGSITSGQTYFIRVQPYESHNGTYQISLSRSTSDSFETALAGGAANLSQGIWANGLLAANGVQWFNFTTTGYTQYIHVSFGSLSDLYLSIYNSDGVLVLNQTNLYNNTTYVNLSTTIGQTYFIRVQPYGSNSGNYQITFNTSTTKPL